MTDNVFATSRTVSYDQVCSTGFRVVWMKALMVDSGDSNGIDAVRIPIKVTLVITGCTVSTRVNENGAFPPTAIGDTVHDGLLDKVTGCLHRLPIIGGSPTTAVDRGFLEAEVERGGLINVGDGSRQYPNTRDFGVPGNTHTAYIVFNSADLARTASSMMIIKQFGGREVFVVVEIVRTLGPLLTRSCKRLEIMKYIIRTHEVGSYIRVLIGKSVVYEGGNNTFPCEAQIPETGDVHRMFRIRGVYQVPLPGE
jgi:hypothetical protein